MNVLITAQHCAIYKIWYCTYWTELTYIQSIHKSHLNTDFKKICNPFWITDSLLGLELVHSTLISAFLTLITYGTLFLKRKQLHV